jgi:hypothetical protein
MKRTLIAVALVTLLGGGSQAQESTSASTSAPPPTALERVDVTHRFGAGLIVGEPTGASLKYFLTDKTAIDGAIGWGFHDETDLHLHSDFLWHLNDICSVPDGQLSLYFGVGARVKFRDNADDRVGVRVPVGVSYMLENVPVDVFLEVAPIIDFTPSTRGGFTAGIGARFWF